MDLPRPLDGAPPDGARPLAALAPLPLPGPAPAGAALDAYLALLDAPGAAPPLLTLRVYADGQLIVSYAERGVTYRKPVSVEALRQAATQLPADSGWLAAGLLRWGATALGPFGLLFVPPRVHPLVLTAADAGPPARVAVPLPGLLWAGVGGRYYVWALRAPAFDPRAVLYHAPLSNVFADDTVCWGQNPPPPVGPAALPAALELFLHESPFTAAAGNGKSRAAPDDIRRPLRALAAAGAPTYPLDDLVPLAPRGPGAPPPRAGAWIDALLEREGGSG